MSPSLSGQDSTVHVMEPSGVPLPTSSPLPLRSGSAVSVYTKETEKEKKEKRGRNRKEMLREGMRKDGERRSTMAGRSGSCKWQV